MAAVAEVSMLIYESEASIQIYHRIFRTDYGHTEVAAHFGNGELDYWMLYLPKLNISAA